jgi:hypothetical protein
MNYKVLHNQSLLDFTLNHCGSLESILTIATVNNLSITDELIPGQVLNIPSDVIVDSYIRDYYYQKNIKPACGYPKIKDNELEFPYEFAIQF